MKKLTHILWAMIICLCLPYTATADGKDDSKYLAGAVPEVDGKVVFSKEYSIPGMTEKEIFDRTLNWMDARLKKNENNSRVVYSQEAEGQIVGTGEEWIVFSSTALALDRTRVTYQLVVDCAPEKCTLKIGKVRFIYREGKEKYTAEEWIVDKYALNKDKTKLVRGLAKWRRKTVDFVDDLGISLAEALSLATPIQKEEKEAGQKPAQPVPTIITPKKQVTIVETPKAEEAPAKTQSGYREVSPEQLTTDLIQTGNGKLVIVIGEEPFNMTMMTANAGGSLGKVNGKPVVFSILSPEQSYEQMEKAESYTVRFYPNGEKEPSVILECKKMPSPAAIEGMPRTYVGEIVKASVK